MVNKKGINEVIKQYPLISKFLSHNGIDCANCFIGTCHLENILDIHNFSKEDQVKMYEHMNKLMNNESDEMKKFIPETKAKESSQIITILKEEHIYIKELLYLLDYIITKNNFYEKYKKDICQILEYIKLFADECHHSKEENLLFVLFKNNEVVQLMLNEHDMGRDYRKKITSSNDENVIKKSIMALSCLLKDHIHKEDTVLFPYLDKMLSKEQIDTINNYLLNQNINLQNEVKLFLNNFNAKEFNM